MNDRTQTRSSKPQISVEQIDALSPADLNDLCDATDDAIEAGGGFGWVRLPSRDILERFWQGTLVNPQRHLFVARLDGAICGAAQLVLPPRNNEAQSFAVTLTTNFIAPWGRGHGLARMMLDEVEARARDLGFAVINLDVRETQEAAIALYESTGYVHFATHPHYARVEDQTVQGRYYYKVLDSAISG